MRFFVLCLILLPTLIFADSAFAEMSSASYQIKWDTIASGGLDDSSSASYLLQDTLGNAAIGDSSSATYQLKAGYRQRIEEVILFDTFAQASSGTEATALVGTTITVTSTTGFSTGNMVAIIQDQGAGQVVGIGEISGIAGNDITLDAIETGGPALTIDGSDDYLYPMTGGSINFEELDPNVLYQYLIGWEITTGSSNGYTVSVIEDSNLVYSSFDIDDVTDGVIDGTDEEYGGRSTDLTLANSTFDTEDTAFTSDYQEIGSESTPVTNDRDLLTLKIAIDNSTAEGTYKQTLSIIASAHY